MTRHGNWTQHTRRYIATKHVHHIARARRVCRDAAVSSFLEALQAAVEAGPATYDNAMRRLMSVGFELAAVRRESGEVESAAVIEIGTLMETANLVEDMLEKAPPETMPMIAKACTRCIQLAEAHDFYECEGHFRTWWAVYQMKLNHWNEAETYLTKAIHLLRLESDGPDASVRAELARALQTHASLLRHSFRYHDAATVCEEALAILEGLASNAYRRDGGQLGATYLTMADIMDEMRLPDEAWPYYDRAFAEFSSLAGVDRESCAWELNAPKRAMVRNNQTACWVRWRSFSYGGIRNDTGEEVLARAEEAIGEFEELAERWPALHLGNLAMAESNCGKVLHELGRPEKAEELFCRALGHLAALPEDVRAREMHNVLATQQARASLLRDCGYYTRAQSILEENLDVIELLAARQPEEYGALHSGWVNNLANVLEDIRRVDGSSKPLDRRIQDLSTHAIRDAERERDDSLLHLRKGSNAASYRRLTTALSQGGSADRLFRSLAAVREGHVRAFGEDADQGLSAALVALRAASERLARPLHVVVAEALFDGQSLFAVLGPDPGEFTWETVNIEGVATRLLATILEVFDRNVDPATGKERYERIRQAGGDLWHALPNGVREALAPSFPGDVLISGDLFWTQFPWEAINTSPDEAAWLGRERPLARWGPLTGPALGRIRTSVFGTGSNAAIVVCSHNVPATNELASAPKEAEAVGKALRDRGVHLLPSGLPLSGESATLEGFAKLLPMHASLIHYIGHGALVGDEEALVFRMQLPRGGCKKAYFGRKEIRDLKKTLGSDDPVLDSGPLVVLNSCEIGRSRAYGGQREDIAATFLDEGAKAVIASPTTIFDELAGRFGSELYAGYDSSKGMAEHFMYVRNRVEQHYSESQHLHWPTWTLLHYHGNPYVTLPGTATATAQG